MVWWLSVTYRHLIFPIYSYFTHHSLLCMLTMDPMDFHGTKSNKQTKNKANIKEDPRNKMNKIPCLETIPRSKELNSSPPVGETTNLFSPILGDAQRGATIRQNEKNGAADKLAAFFLIQTAVVLGIAVKLWSCWGRMLGYRPDIHELFAGFSMAVSSQQHVTSAWPSGVFPTFFHHWVNKTESDNASQFISQVFLTAPSNHYLFSPTVGAWTFFWDFQLSTAPALGSGFLMFVLFPKSVWLNLKKCICMCLLFLANTCKKNKQ